MDLRLNSPLICEHSLWVLQHGMLTLDSNHVDNSSCYHNVMILSLLVTNQLERKLNYRLVRMRSSLVDSVNMVGNIAAGDDGD